jgi:hypothetical protein
MRSKGIPLGFRMDVLLAVGSAVTMLAASARIGDSETRNGILGQLNEHLVRDQRACGVRITAGCFEFCRVDKGFGCCPMVSIESGTEIQAKHYQRISAYSWRASWSLLLAASVPPAGDKRPEPWTKANQRL